MAAVLGARGTLPGYFTGAESRVDPAVISFEKELEYFTALIKRAGKKPATAESRQKVYVLSLKITLGLYSRSRAVFQARRPEPLGADCFH